MRVPARIIATEKLVREMDEAVYQQISNVATYRESRAMRFACRMAIAVMDFPSAVSLPWMCTKAA
jgi:RNA-splicing ligase RtcB